MLGRGISEEYVLSNIRGNQTTMDRMRMASPDNHTPHVRDAMIPIPNTYRGIATARYVPTFNAYC